MLLVQRSFLAEPKRLACPGFQYTSQVRPSPPAPEGRLATLQERVLMNRTQAPRLTPRDWSEVYYALHTKEKLLRDGLYGRDREARRWRTHLAAIRRKIIRSGIQV